ncbi:helix-turn-helix domain-containing protein [Microbacterium resistens]|uniref:Helix-turn-helix domain-containing protein n=1 Tax=Microbacterium resistens TaxID=156977 RepID=A0ABY3RQS8_9MICO|nr:helix-turn-helix domain-containing protein [Microbacterium resistens]UGS26309.1 helix-turn-helix domain-containing protein [Microbacterium resistens]
MEHYTAEVEVAERGPLTNEKIDQAMDYLADYAPSLSVTPRGHHSARITLPADSIGQAARTAALLAEHALASTVIRLDVMTEAEADLREGAADVPELIGVPEAAELLHVSAQRVRQMIAEGKLAAHRIGERSYALVRAEVEAKAA